MIRIELPEHVRIIIETLTAAGHEAYAVGGCVRDSVMGRKPKDWDITTSAMPMEVKELFRHTVDTGIKHGTVTVLLGGTGYEVTTYRIDGSYTDGRHPDEVVFTKKLHEDLLRRDFCMNAMAYNPVTGLEDPYNGLLDIEKGEIGCVGVAYERFTEDALRILRAVRFSAELGFTIKEETIKAAGELSPRLSMVSMERVHAELDKVLLSPHPEILMLAAKLGIMKVILPELELPEDFGDFANAIKNTENLHIKWALFLAAFGISDPGAVLRRLKFDNDTIRDCKMILSHLLYGPEDEEEVKARYFLHEAGSKEAKDLIMETRILLAEFTEYPFGKNPKIGKKYSKAEEKGAKEDEKSRLLSLLENMNKIHEKIYFRGDGLLIKDLTIDGKRLIELGAPQGKILGEILNLLLTKVLENPENNTPERLEALALKEIEKI